MVERKSVAELSARVQVAEDLLRDGRYREALWAYTTLLDGRLEEHARAGSALRAADLVVLERVAELAMLFGHIAAADDLLHAMVQSCRGLGNDLTADYAQLKRAEMRASTGELRAAFDLLGGLEPRIGALDTIEIDAAGLRAWEARIAWRDLGPADLSVLLTRCYAVMGHVLLGLGRYGNAIAMFERGLQHAEAATAPDLARRSHWKLLFLRARALMEQGELDAARAAADGLSDSSMRTQATAVRVQLLELRGKLDLLQGRLGDATRQLRAALAACADGGFVRAHAVAALNLAQALVLLNSIDEALDLAGEADRASQELGDDSLQLRCAAVRQLAIARRSSTAEAVSAALSVREMVEGPARLQGDEIARPAALPDAVPAASHLAAFEDRALAFQWELGASPATAEGTLHVIREVFGHTDSRIVQARLQALEGLLQASRGDDALAAASFDAALQALTAVGLVPECWQVMHLRARSLLRLSRLDEAAEQSSRADALLESLAGSLDAGARAIYLLNKASIEEEHLAAQVEGLVRETVRARDGSMRVRLTARLRVWQRLLELLEHLDRYRDSLADRQLSLPESDAAGSGPQPRRPAWLSRLVRQPRDRATLVFVALPDRLLVIWSAFMRIGYAVSPVTRIALREHVQRWHEHGQGALGALEMTPEQLAAKVAAGDELLARLAGLLRLDDVLAALPARVHRLSIVADDVLHGYPFAALRNADGYLVQRHALSIAFHSGSQPALDRRVASSLVVGVANRSDATRLPAVAEECRRAAAWFARHGIESQLMLEAHAECDAVSARLIDVGMAHLACHGSFEPDQPDQSGLAMADGTLSIRSLAALRLRRCRLVTLLSCWSADSFVLPGRWIISLPEALWRSGAQSVLGSLWPVVDEVAAPLMDHLLEALERLPLDLALREVQLACLAEPGSKARLVDLPISLPFFWAGYQVYGDPSRLFLPSKLAITDRSLRAPTRG